MSKLETSPAFIALKMLIQHIPEDDLKNLAKELNLDLLDSGRDSEVCNLSHEARDEIKAVLVAAGYERGNG